MSSYKSGLLTPPREEEEIILQRRVWPSIIIESGLFIAAALVIYILTRFITVPIAAWQPISLAFAVFPVGLWFVFSYWQEQKAPQPRPRLLLVLIVSALAANAISLPLIEQVFQINRWLPLESAINRIIGYTFTVGMVQEMTKYIILRLLVWPQDINSRLDTVAYGVCAAIGYATIININYIISDAPALDIAVLRMVDNLTVSLAGSLLVAYGLSEVRFTPRIFPLLLPATVALAALITGIAIPIRAGLSNAGISVQFPVGLTSPFRGFLLSVIIVAAVIVAMIFFFDNSERRARESAAEDED